MFFHQGFHNQKQEIPQWFLEARREAYEKLSEFIGKELSPEDLKRMESVVEGLISSWDFPVTHGQFIVKGISIDPVTKRITLVG